MSYTFSRLHAPFHAPRNTEHMATSGKFTDRFLNSLKPRKDAYRVHEKGGDPGFCVRVTSKGSITFYFQYTKNGKRRFLNLGKYPGTSILEARRKLREYARIYESGQDPREVEEAGAIKYGTVSDLVDHYLDYLKENRKPSSYEDAKYRLGVDVLPKIGTKEARAVTPGEVRDILATMIIRGADTSANRTRSYLHAAFARGLHYDNDPTTTRTGIVFALTQNPVEHVPRNASAENVDERVLSWDEIAFLLNYNGKAISRPMWLALMLIMVSGGQRVWSVTRDLKSEMDLNGKVWSIPPEKSKNGRHHLVPITGMMENIILEASAFSEGSPYLFAKRGKPEEHMSNDALPSAVGKFWQRERMEKFAPKDLRTTFKTLGGELGIPRDISDRLQNHAFNDVASKHYDRYSYLKEKREALEVWENALIDIADRTKITV